MQPEMSLAKMLPWMAGGAALAGLENKVIGENLPDELKRVNYGLGMSTGALMALGPKAQMAALGSLPIKQTLLFGIGQADKFRKQQQDLTDTNLETAKINRETSKIDRGNSGSRNAVTLSFMLPALLGAGALAYYSKNHRRKPTGDSKYQVTGERGKPLKHQKIRMDIPPSALPPEFFESLMQADGDDRSHLQVLERNELPKAASTLADKENLHETLGDALKHTIGDPVSNLAGSAEKSIWDSRPARIGRGMGNFAYEGLGIAPAVRAAQGLGTAAGLAADGTSAPGVASRHLAGAVGDALVAGSSANWMLGPLMGKLFGMARWRRALLPGAAGGGPLAYMRRREITNMPNIAQWVLNHGHPGRDLTAMEAAAIKDPGTRKMIMKRLMNTARGDASITGNITAEEYAALKDPAAYQAAVRAANPKTLRASGGLGGNYGIIDADRDARHAFVPRKFEPGAPPTTLGGEALLAARRTMHAGGESTRWLKQLALRNPNMTATVIGTPMAGLGNARDLTRNEAEQKFIQDSLAAGSQVPVSTNLQQLLYGTTTGPEAAITKQLRPQ